MARKTLLTEGEIRQFMKLARLPALGAGKLEEMGIGGGAEISMGRDELEGEEVAMDEPLPGEEDIEAEEEVEVGEVGGGDTEAALVDLLGRIEEWADDQNIAMDLEGGEEEVAIEDEVEIGPEGDLGGALPGEGGLEGGEDEMPPMGLEEKVLREDSGAEEHYDRNRDADDVHIEAIEHHLAALKGDRDYDTEHVEEQSSSKEDDIVAEVSRRVAARLAKQQKGNDLSEKLAERILNRITSAK